MAETDDISGKKRGKYNISQREFAKREIRKLLIAGHTNDEIASQLQLPKRTLERYLHDMLAEDSNLLLNPSRQEVLEEVAHFRLQLASQQVDVMSIANNEQEDGVVRLQAHQLGADLGWARLCLSLRTPDWLARRLRIGPNELIAEQKGFNLKLVETATTRSQPLPSHYEEAISNNNNPENNNSKES